MLREIVSGTHLGAHINKNVSITGFVMEISPNGLWFEMKTTDNQVVRISLQRPIDNPIEGYVEVHGKSTGKGITADDYITFSNESFDAKAYNSMCTLLNSVPNLWHTS
ncbi:unnamed protein product [Phaedon cochleariae]|uniref:Replication protein A 14 kDa subunit n=1 Tax=Phaedon cochleariae TaxID=80249 RepID=A0A9P0DPE4_PHACE|nr:unnamed protein product [Phaedon cochleariae]